MLKILLSLIVFSTIANAKDIELTEKNCVVFNQPVSNGYVAKKTVEIINKSFNESELYLVMETPGGSVMAGLQFIDTIKALNIKVHTITLFAASMGYQIVQEFGTRYITASGTLMSHRGSISGISGQVPGELNSRLNYIQGLLSRMSDVSSKRSGMSKSDYDAAVVNELWLFGQNAVNAGHADELANVKCSKELFNQTYTELFATIFGSATVTYSRCPLIPAPLSVEFEKGMKPENMPKVRKQLEGMSRKINLTF
jgi:ATP-dependent protease ClpP protease subunit